MTNKRTFVLERFEAEEDYPLNDPYSFNQVRDCRSSDGVMNLRFHPQLDETTRVKVTRAIYKEVGRENEASLEWGEYVKLNNPRIVIK